MPDAPLLAVQLYTLRNLGLTFEATLHLVADARGEAVETVGRHGLDARSMRAAADRAGVAIASMHLPLDRLRADPEGAADFAAEVGARTLVVPFLAPLERPVDADGWRRLGSSLDDLGRLCARAGVRLAYHNHDFELARFDGAFAIDLLLDAADPDLLAFEPDLAWIVRAGGDPLTFLARHTGRCRLVHAKDLAVEPVASDDAAVALSAGEDGWATVGHGVLPWDTLLPAARAAGVEVFVLEHDLPHDPGAVVRDGLAFLANHPALA